MVPATNRRDFVRILLAGAASLSLPSHAMGQASSRARSTVTGTPLSDNLIHFTTADGPGENIVVATGPDSLVMVNGGREEMSAELLRAAAEGARAARCEWLHVDFEVNLQTFYVDACGFVPTAAGLVAL